MQHDTWNNHAYVKLMQKQKGWRMLTTRGFSIESLLTMQLSGCVIQVVATKKKLLKKSKPTTNFLPSKNCLSSCTGP